MKKNQLGFTLMSLVMVGIVAVLGITYGRHIINIHYESYVLSRIFKDAVAENVNANGDDKQLIKTIRTRAESENVGKLFEDSDLLISKDSGSTLVTVNYRTCAVLNKNWEICADQEVTSK